MNCLNCGKETKGKGLICGKTCENKLREEFDYSITIGECIQTIKKAGKKNIKSVKD